MTRERDADRDARPEGPGGGDPDRGDVGPVPVRDLMKQMTPEPGAPAAEEEPRWDRPDRAFEVGGEEWLARSAGAGAYGTGRRGAARLLAVHFCRASEPDAPVREALVPAGVFPHLRPEELSALFERATPIVARGESRP